MLHSLMAADRPDVSDRSAMLSVARPVLICLLGGFRVVKAGEPVLLPPESKLGILLCRLALAGDHGVPRQELLGLLWPDPDDGMTARCFNTLVTELRRLLRNGSSDIAAVANGDGCYRLHRAAGLAVDVDCFDGWFERGRAADAAGDTAAAREAFELAVNLYRGDLFMGRGGTDDTWLFVERERLRSRCLTTLARASDLASRMGDQDAAMAHAARLLGMDPCSEVGHRLLMHLHMLGGQRAQALHQYRVCVEALRREYGAGPELSTTAFFDLLRDGSWTAAGGTGLIGS